MKKRVRALLAACSSAGLHLFVVVPLGIARLLVDTAPQWEVTYLPAQEDAPEEGAAAQWPPEPLRLAEGKLHPVERFQ